MSDWRPHVTVAVVAVDTDGRLLLVEEHVDGRRVLNQPAGHLEDRESLVDAAIREAREETGWRVEPEAIIGLYRWRHPDSEETFLRTAFYAHAIERIPDAELDAEIEAVRWLTREELKAERPRWRSPLVGRVIADLDAGARYPLAMLQDLP